MTAWLDVVDLIAQRAWSARVDWMLVGSAASAFQGVPLDPADVDVLMRTPSDVATLAGHLNDLAMPEPTPRHPASFLSSRAEPLLAYEAGGEAWTLGRWVVGGVRLEVAHISPTEPTEGLVETHGTRVWEVKIDVTYRGITVPCVPLEVQLATAFVSDKPGRREALATVLKARGVNDMLLLDALKGRGFTPASLGQHPELVAMLPAGLRPPGHRTPTAPAPAGVDQTPPGPPST